MKNFNHEKYQKEKEKDSLRNVINRMNGYLCGEYNGCFVYLGYDNHFDMIKTIINEINVNENTNDFPDFIANYAFIEHFAVSSGKNNKKKGSEFFKNKQKYDMNITNYVDNGYYEGNKVFERINENHSYENFIRHFKSGWSKHIIGAQKELFRDYTKVFLIQCYEHELRADNEWYKFSIDKEILEIINRSIIDYVIFDNGEYVEVIERAYIPNIIDTLNSKEFLAVKGGEVNCVFKDTVGTVKLDSDIIKVKGFEEVTAKS